MISESLSKSDSELDSTSIFSLLPLKIYYSNEIEEIYTKKLSKATFLGLLFGVIGVLIVIIL